MNELADTDTLSARGVPDAPVDPLVGVTDNHPVGPEVVVAATVTDAAPPVLVTFTVCAAGAALPN